MTPGETAARLLELHARLGLHAESLSEAVWRRMPDRERRSRINESPAKQIGYLLETATEEEIKLAIYHAWDGSDDSALGQVNHGQPALATVETPLYQVTVPCGGFLWTRTPAQFREILRSGGLNPAVAQGFPKLAALFRPDLAEVLDKPGGKVSVTFDPAGLLGVLNLRATYDRAFGADSVLFQDVLGQNVTAELIQSRAQ